MKRPSAVLSVALLVLAGTLGEARAGEDPFAGSFRGDGVRLVLERQGGGYAGTLSVNGKSYPAQAERDGTGLRGTFRVGTTDFAFTAELDGGKLTLSSGGGVHLLTKEAASNPLAPPPPPGPKTPLSHPGPKPGKAPQGPAALGNLGPVEKDPNRKWTVAAYLCGDNDLEEVMLSHLNEIEASLPAKGIEVIALVDRSKRYTTSDGDWTDARVFRIRRDDDEKEVHSPILARPGEIDMGDPATLSAFVKGVFTKFPAPHHMVLFCDHGEGWTGSMVDEDAPGAPHHFDDLSVPEMHEGLRTGLTAAGVGRLDLLLFDACLMDQIEVAYELRDTVHVMVASEASMYSWDYHRILPTLAQPWWDSRALGRKLVTAYRKALRGSGVKGITLAALDLDHAAQAVKSLDALARACDPLLSKSWPAFARSLFYADSFVGRNDFWAGRQALASVDLLDALARFHQSVTPFPAEREYRAVVDSVNALVVDSSTDAVRHLSRGLAIYAPVSSEQMSEKYGNLAFSKACGWPSLLDGLFRQEKLHTKKPVFRDERILGPDGKRTEDVKALNSEFLHFTLDGMNVIWTQAWNAEEDPKTGRLRILSKGFVIDPNWMNRWNQAKGFAHATDFFMPQYRDGENRLSAELFGVLFGVADGNRVVPVMLDATSLDPMKPLQAPVLYQDPTLEKPVRAMASFDPTGWVAIGLDGVFPHPDGSVSIRPIRPRKDGRVTFLEEEYDEKGNATFARGDTLTWGDGPELTLRLVEPGNYEVALLAETMSGVRSLDKIHYREVASEVLNGWIGTWKHFDPKLMEGTWTMSTFSRDPRTGKATFVPTGNRYEVRRHPGKPMWFDADATLNMQGKEVHEKTLWVASRTGVPNLRIYEYAKGEHSPAPRTPTALFYGPAEFEITADGTIRLTMKVMDFGGRIWRFVREEKTTPRRPKAAAPDNPDRFEPVPVPDPKPLR